MMTNLFQSHFVLISYMCFISLAQYRVKGLPHLSSEMPDADKVGNYDFKPFKDLAEWV